MFPKREFIREFRLSLQSILATSEAYSVPGADGWFISAIKSLVLRFFLFIEMSPWVKESTIYNPYLFSREATGKTVIKTG